MKPSKRVEDLIRFLPGREQNLTMLLRLLQKRDFEVYLVAFKDAIPLNESNVYIALMEQYLESEDPETLAWFKVRNQTGYRELLVKTLNDEFQSYQASLAFGGFNESQN